MARNYSYKAEYAEKDPKIRYRKCANCKIIHNVNKLETYTTCKPCYTKKYKKKRCRGCHLMKSVGEFHKNKQYRDGLVSTCSDCKKNKRDKHKEKEYKRRYYLKKKIHEKMKLRPAHWTFYIPERPHQL